AGPRWAAMPAGACPARSVMLGSVMLGAMARACQCGGALLGAEACATRPLPEALTSSAQRPPHAVVEATRTGWGPAKDERRAARAPSASGEGHGIAFALPGSSR